MPIKLEKVSYSNSQGRDQKSSTLTDISFEIAAGELTGLLGQAGDGTSVLLKLMAGILRPTKGHIFINGEDINGKKFKHTRHSGLVALVTQQAERQLYEKSVEREVGIVLRGSHLSEQEREACVKDALESVGFDFESVRNRSPLSFSRGERYKIALAAVLSAKPDILLLDEPAALLDAEGRRMLIKLLCSLKDEGRTVVVATNDADILAENAQRVLVLQNGRIIRDGSARSVFTDYYDLIRHDIPMPQVKLAAQRLRDRDINMPSNVMEYEQFIDRLKIIMWRKSR